MAGLDRDTLARIEAHLGRVASDAERIVGGGYTPAERWIVKFTDGGTCFAKIATSELTAGWLRQEHRWYRALGPQPFMAGCLGLLDSELRPVLLLADLSRGRWPPPWQPGEVERVRAALARVAATRPLPADLPDLEQTRQLLSGWTEVAADPGPFLSLGMCTAGWLERCLPALLAAQADAVLAGDDLVHADLRSDNLCLLGGSDPTVVLVDWNMPARGSARFDLAAWAPSLRMEGGPLPEELLPDGGAYAALIAGFFAARAGLPDIPDAPRVRWIQRRQLRIALPWACRALGLPLPDRRWGQAAIDALAADDPRWHEQVEEIVGDLYLSSDDPRAQSGRSGDEVDWRWSRELALDAVVGGGCDLLDVGCANGYLMESLQRWGGERGLAIRPYGLEISDRLAGLARSRLPQWADRIWTGDALTWAAPRHFDLVHTGLDYAPPHQRRALVERILRDLLRPGGRLVVRAERVAPGNPDPVEVLRGLGFEPGGVIEAVHPTREDVRRTAWLTA